MDDTPDFDRWYEATYPHVRSTLAVISGDPDLAADSADEAFARALERWSRVGAMASPKAWVTTVGLNCIRRAKRRRALEASVLGRRRVVEAADPVGAVHPVWTQVAQLPPQQRAVVALRYLGDLTEPDVAAVLGISRGTVASTLADARRRLAAVVNPDVMEEA